MRRSADPAGLRIGLRRVSERPPPWGLVGPRCRRQRGRLGPGMLRIGRNSSLRRNCSYASTSSIAVQPCHMRVITAEFYLAFAFCLRRPRSPRPRCRGLVEDLGVDTRSLLFSASEAAARTVRISSSVAPEWAPVPTTNTVGHSSAAKSDASSPSRRPSRSRLPRTGWETSAGFLNTPASCSVHA